MSFASRYFPSMAAMSGTNRPHEPVFMAYCFAGGIIEFGSTLPTGAIVIARGHEERLREVVSGLARHGYGGGLVVPGVPETTDVDAKVDALTRFQDLVAKAMERNIDRKDMLREWEKSERWP